MYTRLSKHSFQPQRARLRVQHDHNMDFLVIMTKISGSLRFTRTVTAPGRWRPTCQNHIRLLFRSNTGLFNRKYYIDAHFNSLPLPFCGPVMNTNKQFIRKCITVCENVLKILIWFLAYKEHPTTASIRKEWEREKVEPPIRGTIGQSRVIEPRGLVHICSSAWFRTTQRLKKWQLPHKPTSGFHVSIHRLHLW